VPSGLDHKGLALISWSCRVDISIALLDRAYPEFLVNVLAPKGQQLFDNLQFTFFFLIRTKKTG
jgi:hypothetical protein